MSRTRPNPYRGLSVAELTQVQESIPQAELEEGTSRRVQDLYRAYRRWKTKFLQHLPIDERVRQSHADQGKTQVLPYGAPRVDPRASQAHRIASTARTRARKRLARAKRRLDTRAKAQQIRAARAAASAAQLQAYTSTP